MISEHANPVVADGLTSELRRGLLTMAVLAACRSPQYGYSLKQGLATAGFDINEGTLYPLLRRLEEQTLLISEWRLADESRPRRYYLISRAGEAALAALGAEWQALNHSMERLIKESGIARGEHHAEQPVG